MTTALAVSQDEIPIPMPALNKFQRRVWFSPHYNWLLFAGRRSGKTFIAILRAIKVAWTGGRVAWCAADTDQGLAGWNEMVEFVKLHLLDYCTRKDFASQHYIQFSTGGSIKLISAFEKTRTSTKGRGFSYNLIVFDEIQRMSQRFYKRIKPSVLTTNGALVLIGTPPETPDEMEKARWIRQWLDDVQEGVRPQGNWHIEESPTDPEDVAFAMVQEAAALGEKITLEHAIRAAKEFLKEEREDDEMAFRREYLVQWVVDQSRQVYPEFDEDVMVREEYDYNPDWPTYVVIDRGEGGEGATVALRGQFYFLEQSGKQQLGLRIFDEYQTREIISEEEFIGRCITGHDWPLPLLWGYDVRAPGVGNALYNLGLPYSAKTVGIESGINRVRRMIRRGLLQIHPRCLHLIRAIKRYERINGKPSDRGVDACDCLRYMVAIGESEHNINDSETSDVLQELERLMAASGVKAPLTASGVHTLDFGF